MKVLVISFAGIGDSLLVTPLIRALSEQLTPAKIDVFVRWPGARDLLQGNPHLHTILFEESTWAKLRLLWRLRRMHYDISINAYPQSKIEYRVIARFISAWMISLCTWRRWSRCHNKL